MDKYLYFGNDEWVEVLIKENLREMDNASLVNYLEMLMKKRQTVSDNVHKDEYSKMDLDILKEQIVKVENKIIERMNSKEVGDIKVKIKDIIHVRNSVESELKEDHDFMIYVDEEGKVGFWQESVEEEFKGYMCEKKIHVLHRSRWSIDYLEEFKFEKFIENEENDVELWYLINEEKSLERVKEEMKENINEEVFIKRIDEMDKDLDAIMEEMLEPEGFELNGLVFVGEE